MAITNSPAGSNGPHGTAAVRARQKEDGGAESVAADLQARDARVAELRRQYLAGNYHVDAVELSAAILKHHLAKDA